MKKIFKIYIHANLGRFEQGQISIDSMDMQEHFPKDYHLITTQEIELDIPEFDILQIQVDGIDQQIVKIRAESQMQITQLEGRKQELLAIGVDV